MDEVDFDNEHLTVTTDKRVTVFSPQADIYGTGLVISWNESPRELRLLKIVHGEYMAVYNVPEELNMIALPGSEPEAGPATTAPANGRDSRGPGPRHRPRARRRRPPSTAPAKPPARNQYLAEFHDGVKVIHRNRRLTGADVLSLGFDWDSSVAQRVERTDGPGQAQATRRVAADDEPASEPTADPSRPASSPWRSTGPAR